MSNGKEVQEGLFQESQNTQRGDEYGHLQSLETLQDTARGNGLSIVRDQQSSGVCHLRPW